MTYAKYVSQLCSPAKKKKLIDVPENIDSHRYDLAVDWLATGMLFGRFGSLQAGLEVLSDYWSCIDETTGEEAAVSHIKEIINDLVGERISENEKYVKELGYPKYKQIVIPAKVLGERLKLLYVDSQIEIDPKVKNLKPIMAKLGFSLKKSGWVML